MRVINQYECEICGQRYETESEATECEHLHKELDSVQLEWEPTDRKKSYPHTIRVWFKDYHRSVNYQATEGYF